MTTLDPRGAFFGDPAIKAKYMARLKAHAAADNIIQGTGWEDGKGCAIGCTFEDYDHTKYVTELNLPEALGRLEDRIFEDLTNAEAKPMPIAWLDAVTVGSDQSTTPWRFLHWLMLDLAEKSYAQSVRKEILDVALVIEPATTGGEIDHEAAARAARAAETAAGATWAAEAAAEAAAWAARAAEAAWAARAARAAAGAAGAAGAARVAGAAETAEYRRYRDKMLELMASAPMVGAQ